VVAWFLTFYDAHLFQGPFEAWIHGPVHTVLYHTYKEYGWRPIEQVTRDSLTNPNTWKKYCKIPLHELNAGL